MTEQAGSHFTLDAGAYAAGRLAAESADLSGGRKGIEKS